MFSLIITTISIALVAALALATLYYGGSAFNKGSADASAAKVMLQGQQLLGAAELYKADTGQWPASIAALAAANYLKSATVAASPAPMGHALAAGQPWDMPSPGTPVFVLREVPTAVCQSVNKKGYGVDAILKTARTAYLYQCFGLSTSALTVVVGKSSADLDYAAADPLAAGALGVVSSLPAPADRTADDWLVTGREPPPAEPFVPALPVIPAAPAPGLAYEVNGVPREALVFGPTQELTASAAQAVIVRNTGNVALSFPSGALAGAPFSISEDTCAAALLLPLSTCSVRVTFTPPAATAYAGTLSLPDASLPGLALEGTGTATPVPVASLSTLFLDFGSVATNTTVTRQVVLSNPGTGVLVLTAAPSITDASSASLSPGLTTCAGSLAVNDSCLTEIVYSPTEVGAAAGTLTYATNADGSPGNVALTGTAYNPVSLAAGTLPEGQTEEAYEPFSFSSLLDVANENSPTLGEVSWSSTGTLPAGLSLSTDGVLSGTPTEVTASSGAGFTVLATYKLNEGQQAYSLQVGNDVLEVTSISSGGHHTCAVTPQNGVKCWGRDDYGQLGNDTVKASQATPVDVLGMTSGVASVSAGWYHTCAVTTGGTAKCWGNDGNGQLGNDATLSHKPTPVSVSGLSSAVLSISAGGFHTCALTVGGGAKCWGRDFYGQLGNDALLANSPAPVDVSGMTTGVAGVSAGYGHSCAVMATGEVKCWGNDLQGQLGNDAALESQGTPVPVLGLLSNVASISVGYYHTCALTTAGVAKCWGEGTYGELGDGAAPGYQGTPVDVSGMPNGVSSISAGLYHTCAVTTAGEAKCWGRDDYGQLGDDAALSNQPTPAAIPGLSSGVARFSAGANHTCAVTAAGTAKCWGRDDYGQLGNGAALADRSTPVKVKP